MSYLEKLDNLKEKNMKIESVNQHLEEKLKNPQFRKLYEIEMRKLPKIKQKIYDSLKTKGGSYG